MVGMIGTWPAGDQFAVDHRFDLHPVIPSDFAGVCLIGQDGFDRCS
jgi:hypothetical protein